MARGSGINYLNITLEALLCQLPPLEATPRVCIGVFEPRHAQSASPTPFELARAALARASPAVRARVLFVRPPSEAATAGGDAEAAALDGAVRRAEKAIEKVALARGASSHLAATKRQTFDVARMLLALRPLTSRYLVVMEDDWLLCDGAMGALLYLLSKARLLHEHAWAMLRFSYGLNGLLLQARDVQPTARFLLDPAADEENNLPDAPVDHLAYRWFRGKYRHGRAHFGSRRILAFRHALFWHFGDASAIGNANTRHKPKCYALNREWLFELESFHQDACPDDDMCPCDARPADGSAAARALRLLEERTFTANAAAERCGARRVCWGRPAAGPSCASRLQCGGARDGIDKRAPCLRTLPEYADR